MTSFLGFAVEIDQRYLECSLNNNSVWTDNSLVVEAPMQDVNVADLPQVDILLAGLPCTGASIAGKSKNKLTFAEDHNGAGTLFLSFINILRAVNPAVAVLENVPQYAATASMSVIRAALTAMGYDLHETVLNGNKFGALENRDRFVMVAVTSGMDCDLQEIIPVRQKESCLAEILEPVADDDPMWNEYGYLKSKAVKDLAAGKGFAMQVLDPSAVLCGTIGRGYSKIRSTELKIAHPTNPDLMRQITVKEHAAVKAIPVELVHGVSNTVAHEILGQSVIYSMFTEVGAYLGKIINRWAEAVKETLEAEIIYPAGHQFVLFG